MHYIFKVDDYFPAQMATFDSFVRLRDVVEFEHFMYHRNDLQRKRSSENQVERDSFKRVTCLL